MKIKDQDGRVRDIPVYGCFSGLKISSLEITPSDLFHLLAESDETIRKWIEDMSHRLNPDLARPNPTARKPKIEMVE